MVLEQWLNTFSDPAERARAVGHIEGMKLTQRLVRKRAQRHMDQQEEEGIDDVRLIELAD